jgi:hypothetical protein
MSEGAKELGPADSMSEGAKELKPSDSMSEEVKELGPADSTYGLIIQNNILMSQIEEELKILTEEKSIAQAAEVIKANVRTVLMMIKKHFQSKIFHVPLLHAFYFDFLK